MSESSEISALTDRNPTPAPLPQRKFKSAECPLLINTKKSSSKPSLIGRFEKVVGYMAVDGCGYVQGSEWVMETRRIGLHRCLEQWILKRDRIFHVGDLATRLNDNATVHRPLKATHCTSTQVPPAANT